MYEYKVISGQITVDYKKNETFEIALEKILNNMQEQGWEFYTPGTITEFVSPGCLGVLFGKPGEIRSHQTFIFRRKKQQSDK